MIVLNKRGDNVVTQINERSLNVCYVYILYGILMAFSGHSRCAKIVFYVCISARVRNFVWVHIPKYRGCLGSI